MLDFVYSIPLSYYAITGLVNFLTSACLGFFIYSKNTMARVNKTFAFFCLTVAQWSLCYFIWLSVKDIGVAKFCLRTCMIGVVFMPVVFTHFILCLLNHKINKKILYLNYLVGVIIAGTIYSPLYATDFKPFLVFPCWGKAGIIFPLHLAHFFINIIYSHYLMIVAINRTDSPIIKKQIMYVFIGTIIGYFGGIANYLCWYRIPIPPVSNILVSVYVAFVAYAIIRHQLLDIEIIIKKTLVFAGLLASVLMMLVLPTLIIQEYLLRGAGFNARLIGLTISGILMIVTIRKIEDFLINVTDRYLFQKKYDYKELLKTFTSEVLTVLNLDRLLHLTVDKLKDIIKLSSCAVLLFDDEKEEFQVMSSSNIKDSSITLIRPDRFVSFLEHTHGYLLKKEMVDKKISMPDDIVMVMDKLNAELVIPLVLHEKLIGMLSLGNKKSDEPYTQDDLDIFMPLARTLAIAISNAELFEELGKTQAEAAQKEKMAVIGTLSAGINHEICNPLGIARGQCEAFLLNVKDGLYKSKTTEELLAKAKEIMAKVIKETDRATTITKKLSSFAKPAKGEAELIDIGRELDEVIGLVGYELKLDKIEIVREVEKDLPRILADRKQFQEVLFNLIRNAGQAIEKEGRITVKARNMRGRIIIDIQDTGSGIGEDKIKELFNPFFTTKGPGKGTGLGLFIVRQVVEKNGGRIFLKNTKVDGGTTFTIEFPVSNLQEARA
ncbi:MAG: GAF domain-containing protein [Candidatus Omnitrophica bacterium]|nr:GAF domain-containing protein [Candidatus Omnitrophota bacterium]